MEGDNRDFVLKVYRNHTVMEDSSKMKFRKPFITTITLMFIIITITARENQIKPWHCYKKSGHSVLKCSEIVP